MNTVNTKQSSEAYMPIWLWIIVSIISKFFSIRILNTTVSEQFSLLYCLLSIAITRTPNGECLFAIHWFCLKCLFAVRFMAAHFVLNLDPESRSCLSWLLLLCGLRIIILFILLIIFSCRMVNPTISCLFDEVYLFVGLSWLWNGLLFVFFIFIFHQTKSENREHSHERAKHVIHCDSFVE